jgi:hypothetical protein
MKKLIVVIAMAVLINFGLLVYVAVDNAETENEQEAIAVKNSTGEYVGTVTNLLVDSSGNIAFIILSLGKDREQGKKEIAVPLGMFSYDHENRIIVLNVDKRELAAAPSFAMSDLTDPSFAEKVYRFFGLMPGWTEEQENDELSL